MEVNRYMAKMRVHELAKELNIDSKEVLTILKGTEYEVKTSSNSIEDAAQNFVRGKVSGAKTKPAAPKAETEKKEQPKQETVKVGQAKSEQPKQAESAVKPERPKKKASISAVFNPQNSKQLGGRRRDIIQTRGTSAGRETTGNKTGRGASHAAGREDGRHVTGSKASCDTERENDSDTGKSTGTATAADEGAGGNRKATGEAGCNQNSETNRSGASGNQRQDIGGACCSTGKSRRDKTRGAG